MSTRVQVILTTEERESFRRQAEKEGLSLSAWLREAGRRRLNEGATAPIRTLRDLRALYRALDERDGPDREPDWEEHLAVIEASRASGRAPT